MSEPEKAPTVSAKPDNPEERIGINALTAFWIATVAGFVVLLVYAVSTHAGMSAFSVGAVIAGASLVTGALLGFLFGIPRSLTDERNGGAAPPNGGTDANGGGTGSRVGYGANTNLEQISDWLTKILVGVGLVQLRELDSSLRRLTTFVAPALGTGEGARPFVLGIIVYFAVCGFLAGYLWTRLFLPGALRLADLSALGEKLRREVEKASERAETRLQQVEDAVKRQQEDDAAALSLVTRQLEPVPGLNPPTQAELDEAVTKASATAKLTIFSVAHRLRSENWENGKDKMERTIPVFRALIASDRENKYPRNHADLGFALKDKNPPDYAEAVKALERAIEIRGDWHVKGWVLYEYNVAICRIELDPDYSAGKASSGEARSAIIGYLAAAQRGMGELRPSTAIDMWMKLNSVSREELEKQTAE